MVYFKQTIVKLITIILTFIFSTTFTTFGQAKPSSKKQNIEYLKNIKYVFENYIQYKESTDSPSNKDLMKKSLESLTVVKSKEDLDLLINVWMYYDPTDFASIPEVYRILKGSRPQSIEAAKRRIANKKKWESEKTAPYSDLKKLLEQLESE
jgi:hypothetical protein